LQAFACEIDAALAWTDRRRIPPKLIQFVTSVLQEAKIRYPSFTTSPDKFRRLMQRPARSATCKAHHSSGVDVTLAETEREDRLAKMFLPAAGELGGPPCQREVLQNYKSWDGKCGAQSAAEERVVARHGPARTEVDPAARSSNHPLNRRR
jgi:hypothetical protein